MKKAFVSRKKDLVDKMAKALDVNPYTLYDTAGRDAPVCMWFDYGVLNGKSTDLIPVMIAGNLSLKSSRKRTFKITNRNLWR